MKNALLSIAVIAAFAASAHADKQPVAEDRAGEGDTLVVAEICQAPAVGEAAASERFRRAAEVIRKECAKPGWSWQD